MPRLLLTMPFSAAIAMAGCATSQTIHGPDGQQLKLIECGAATPLGVCYRRAESDCPNGYRTVSEETGINRTTIKVQCVDGANNGR